MQYKKINLELIVPADEAEGMVTELNAALDRMEDRFSIFGGETNIAAIEQPGARRKSALDHTVAASKTAVSAVRSAGGHVSSALRRVI
jgi:hypothetical protein